MARLLKGQLQLQFLCKMNALDNKGLIYTHCIENKKIEKDMAKALNVYQTLAMRYEYHPNKIHLNLINLRILVF